MRVAEISCISRAPATVPRTRTRPPVSGVPPTTTAVIADSSIRLPTTTGRRRSSRAVGEIAGERGERGAEDVDRRSASAGPGARPGRSRRGCRRWRRRSGRRSCARRANADHEGDGQRDQHHDGHAQDAARCRWSARVGSKISLSWPLGDDQRQAAAADEQRERGDDRLQPEARRQHAVDHARRRRRRGARSRWPTTGP